MVVHSRETPASQCTVTLIAGGGAQVESSQTWGGGGACGQDIHGESWIFIRKVLANVKVSKISAIIFQVTWNQGEKLGYTLISFNPSVYYWDCFVANQDYFYMHGVTAPTMQITRKAFILIGTLPCI